MQDLHSLAVEEHADLGCLRHNADRSRSRGLAGPRRLKCDARRRMRNVSYSSRTWTLLALRLSLFLLCHSCSACRQLYFPFFSHPSFTPAVGERLEYHFNTFWLVAKATARLRTLFAIIFGLIIYAGLWRNEELRRFDLVFLLNCWLGVLSKFNTIF